MSESVGGEWSEESLFCKARLYAEQMGSFASNDWQFAFWSALTLEFVGRAALAHISPVLIAESRNWQNLLHALGRESTDLKARRSIPTESVFDRLGELLLEFTPEMKRFCIVHLQRRNEELHSGAIVFDVLSTSTWLPKFYWACDALLKSMDRDLSHLVEDPAATDLIDALLDEAGASVRESIANHAGVWEEMTADERSTAARQAEDWASRRLGHRVPCPSCECAALLRGTPHGRVLTEANDEEVVQRQAYLPSSFRCVACNLRIAGYSKLMACGLGDSFTSTSVTSPEEFYGLFTEEDLEEARDEAARGYGDIYEPNFND
ncbi:MAG: hypothetical protein OXP37_10090 [Chloroflexota bacterium]|nr:hypothetical protein [Chloroflexota bacterium]